MKNLSEIICENYIDEALSLEYKNQLNKLCEAEKNFLSCLSQAQKESYYSKITLY